MIQSKARYAVLWSSLDTLVRQGAGFVMSIILARLLVPEDFGMVALLSIFIGIASIFVNAGLGVALIQNQGATHVDESTVFWFNLASGVAMMFALFACAPLIAKLFNIPILEPLTMVMAANVAIGSLSSIHSTLMAKKLDFKTPMKIGLTSTVLSGGGGIYMAWSGYGFWALAAQNLLGNLITAVLFWWLNSWRPLRVFSMGSFNKLFGFGGWIFISGLIDVVYQRSYTLLIGKFYGIYDLGIYNRADNTQQLVTSGLTDALSRVAFPLFSTINHDKELLRRGMRRAVQVMMLCTAPIMMGLAALAEPFISVVFGENWRPSAQILQILCFAGLLYPLHVINLNALQAQGHSKQFFNLEVAKKTLGVVLLLLGSVFGLIGIAAARVAGSIFALVINCYYTGRYLNYGFFEQLKDCLPATLSAFLMAVAIHMMSYEVSAINAIYLSVLIVSGALIYLMANLIININGCKQAISLVMRPAREK